MDAPEQLADQDRADRQPIDVPIQRLFPIMDPQRSKKGLAIEQFQPILETLADLDRDDPKLAFQAARSVGIF
ncbi:hypothetical protein PITC_094780 [Penicillium italicum]|uniref:Uncharacterized protein n=1 Tax=Penicillium italicum TaxID=40296 RepID=A0A0A2KND8_PENIT|nr:hypothetical protein PITC_094780 [Penicillium italicum]